MTIEREKIFYMHILHYKRGITMKFLITHHIQRLQFKDLKVKWYVFIVLLWIKRLDDFYEFSCLFFRKLNMSRNDIKCISAYYRSSLSKVLWTVFFSEIRMAHNPSSFHQGAHPHYHRPNMRQPPGKFKFFFYFIQHSLNS